MNSFIPLKPPNQTVGISSWEVIAPKITNGWGNDLSTWERFEHGTLERRARCYGTLTKVFGGREFRLFRVSEVRIPGVGLRPEPANSAQCYWLVNRRTREVNGEYRASWDAKRKLQCIFYRTPRAKGGLGTRKISRRNTACLISLLLLVISGIIHRANSRF